MKAIRVYGSSDDLIEWSGCESAGEFYAAVEGMGYHAASFILSSKECSERIKVHALYDGCWSFAVGQVEEGDMLPAWQIVISNSEHNEYSTGLTIFAPDDVEIVMENE